MLKLVPNKGADVSVYEIVTQNLSQSFENFIERKKIIERHFHQNRESTKIPQMKFEKSPKLIHVKIPQTQTNYRSEKTKSSCILSNLETSFLNLLFSFESAFTSFKATRYARLNNAAFPSKIIKSEITTKYCFFQYSMYYEKLHIFI